MRRSGHPLSRTTRRRRSTTSWRPSCGPATSASPLVVPGCRPSSEGGERQSPRIGRTRAVTTRQSRSPGPSRTGARRRPSRSSWSPTARPTCCAGTWPPGGSPGPDVRVVVVDNFSTADEPARGRGARRGAGLARRRHAGQPRLRRGLQRRRRRRRARWAAATFLFLNPDAVDQPATVVAELAGAQPARAHGADQPAARRLRRAGSSSAWPAPTCATAGSAAGRPTADPATTDPGDWLCGACVVVHDELLDRIGGFDEGYFLYWEDVDLGYRAVAGRRLAWSCARTWSPSTTRAARTPTAGRRAPSRPCTTATTAATGWPSPPATWTGARLLRWLLRDPGGQLGDPAARRAAAAAALAAACCGRPWRARSPASAWPCRPSSPDRRPRARRPSVLVVHPGAELYGSDRVLARVGRRRCCRPPTWSSRCPGTGRSPPSWSAAARAVVDLPDAGAAQGGRCARPGSLAAAPRRRRWASCPALAAAAPARRRRRRRQHARSSRPGCCSPGWPAGRWSATCTRRSGRGRRSLQPRCCSLPLRAARTVVANSRFTRDVLTGLVPGLAARTDRASPTPCRGRPSPAPPRDRLDGPVRLLFVGRLSPRKGPDVAIAALRELRRPRRRRPADAARVGVPGLRVVRGAAARQRPPTWAGRSGRVRSASGADVWPAPAPRPTWCSSRRCSTSPSATPRSRRCSPPGPPWSAACSGSARGRRTATRGAQVVEPGRPGLWADAVERVVADWAAFRTAAVADAADRPGPARAGAVPARARALLLGRTIVGRPGRRAEDVPGQRSVPTTRGAGPVVLR